MELVGRTEELKALEDLFRIRAGDLCGIRSPSCR